jgi:hypothetical protein
MRWPPPVRLALVSSAAACAALGVALASTAAPSEAALRERSLTQSPERVAEAFIVAYDARDYARAAAVASEPLQVRLRARARRTPGAQTPANAQESSFVIEESYFLSEGRLRLLGELTRAGAQQTTGWPVAILVGRHGDRFLVENVTWPKGPLPETP